MKNGIDGYSRRWRREILARRAAKLMAYAAREAEEMERAAGLDRGLARHNAWRAVRLALRLRLGRRVLHRYETELGAACRKIGASLGGDARAIELVAFHMSVTARAQLAFGQAAAPSSEEELAVGRLISRPDLLLQALAAERTYRSGSRA